MARVTSGSRCKCGSEVQIGAQFCTRCGNRFSSGICFACGQALLGEARFCTCCGARLPTGPSNANATALENLMLGLELALHMIEPDHAICNSIKSLDQHPSSAYSAVASLILMASHARLGDLARARSSLVSARQFYADHLGLADDQRTRFVKDGHLTDDLQAFGDRDIQANPWLYFLIGHSYGPRLPEAYLGNSETERLNKAGRDWADFFSDRREEATKTLSYIYFANGRIADARRYLEKAVLIARKYESLAPTRVEVVWPKVILGECCWAIGREAEAASFWQGARSTEICAEPDLNQWDRFGLSWIDTAKAKLQEHAIPIPRPEISRESSEHLRDAVRALLDAEECEASGVDLEELGAMIRQAGQRYSEALRRAAEHLAAVTRLDEFTWAKVPIGDSSYWFRHEQVKGMLLQKMALLQLSNEKLAVAIADYKQAMDIWPALSAYGLMGGLQAACGLNSDARQTYQACISHAEEFGAVESSKDRELILQEIRTALIQLPA